ncbi:hypothetical protein ACFHW2_12060 [Actinomadura sp. LOL_016]|uniref:hypothetical protein n=1 Tax=unclassified Actinomadura TaxID=2626254 RepID=UPI003A80922E
MPDPEHTVRAGQVYESCDPRGGPTIRITAYTPGANRADVVDAADGKRPRAVLVRSLHASRTTKHGEPRRTGYRLIFQEANRA